MSDREYMDADYEVIRMVNRGHGPGGELPSVTRTFIPSDRVEKVEALDRRIQQVQKAMPYIATGACLLCWLIGWAM
jgi:hypothetical protein